ncbi:hypothetical protein ILYODFUR_029492 [Ilyodon furcidens]|uniref:Uncharacterized protein n=1 Tax=Ilyodon furcidens TaxID=33524 RepID=A0ABV0SQ74_9TELE
MLQMLVTGQGLQLKSEWSKWVPSYIASCDVRLGRPVISVAMSWIQNGRKRQEAWWRPATCKWSNSQQTSGPTCPWARYFTHLGPPGALTTISRQGSRLYGSPTSVSMPMASCDYNVAYHCQCVNG